MSRERKSPSGTLTTGAPPAAVWVAGTFQTVLGAVISAYITTKSALVTSLAVAAALVVVLAVVRTSRRARLGAARENLEGEPHTAPVRKTYGRGAQDERPAGTGSRSNVCGS